jgi:large subunit ribosomal protein L9
MEIILLKDVDKLGDKHEVLTVKDGFGRNYLIPQGLAIIANSTNMAKLEEIKRKEAEELAARKAEFKAMAETLREKVLQIGAKAGASGKIFGSVTNVQLASAIKEQFGLDVERKRIVLPEEVKNLGTYTAEIKLHPEVDMKVNFEVVAE